MHALVPIFAYFFVGVLLRKLKIASREHALFLFRLIFFVTLPALVFTTLSVSDLALNSLVLPLVGFLVNLVCACIAFVYARMMGLDRSLAGAVILGASITNMVIIFPFIHASLGISALADAVLYDVGNSAFVTTVAYAVTSRYGEAADSSVWVSVGKTLRTPLFLALFAAVGVSIWSVQVPVLLSELLAPLGAATMPLILVALGALFSTARLGDSIVYSTVFIRMVGGFLAASFFVYVFNLQGATAVTVIAAGAAPIGFNSVTLASIGKLDTEHAAASLSASVAIGLVTTSAIVVLGARWLGLSG